MAAAMLAVQLVFVPNLAEAEGHHAAATLDQLIQDFERSELEADPIRAGLAGDLESSSRWPDASFEAVAQRRTLDRDLYKRLQSISPAELPESEQINYLVLDHLLSSRITLAAFDRERIPFTNDSGFFATPFQVARTTRIMNLDQAEAWLLRIERIPAWLDQHMAWLERGIETDTVQPAYVVKAVVDQVMHINATPSQNSPLLAPFEGLPKALEAEHGAALRARAGRAIEQRVGPAFARLERFFVDTYLAEPRNSIGIADIPKGRALYRALVRYHTTLDTSPEAIHQRGLDEVQRIRAEMEKIIAETGFEGNFAAFVEHLRTDSKFYARTGHELLMHAAWIAKRADDAMPSLFRNLARLPYGVRPVPPELAPTYTTGRYWPGNADQGIAGAFMVNTYALDQRPLYALPALTLHEGVPGHHHQFALSSDMDHVPRFRRNLYLTAFNEGWGLYAERLGLDMNIYTTPYEHFGRLSYEMWRACRLVVDTGIHYFGWTREQAEACLLENSALAPRNVTTEVARYISWPGQALAYKPGELLIRELRSQAEQTLGTEFDLRSFHDVLLSDGAIPLNALEQKMKDWIADQSNPPESTAASSIELAGTSWRLSMLADQPTDAAEITMHFAADGRVSGRSACNRYFGQWTLDDRDQLEFSHLGSSKMACEPALMALEAQFHQTVRSVAKLSITADGMLQAAQQGQTVWTARGIDHPD